MKRNLLLPMLAALALSPAAHASTWYAEYATPGLNVDLSNPITSFTFKDSSTTQLEFAQSFTLAVPTTAALFDRGGFVAQGIPLPAPFIAYFSGGVRPCTLGSPLMACYTFNVGYIPVRAEEPPTATLMVSLSGPAVIGGPQTAVLPLFGFGLPLPPTFVLFGSTLAMFLAGCALRGLPKRILDRA